MKRRVLDGGLPPGLNSPQRTASREMEMNIGEKLLSLSDFGGTDADNDPLLIDCFEDHPTYLRVKGGRVSVVLGRKGSGKTAVYKRIIQEFPEQSIGFNYSDYPWAHHALQKQLGVPEEQCFVESWKYFCLIALSKAVLKAEYLPPSEYDRVQIIRTFLRDTYGTDNPEPSKIFSPGSKFVLKPNIGASLGIFRAGVSGESVDMASLPKFAHEVNSFIAKTLFNIMSGGRRYYLLFDQLDQGLDLVSGEYRLRLIGLLLACKSLNDLAAHHSAKLSCCVFLRDDVYEVLKFEDKNKITQNLVGYIKWDVGASGSESSLRSLMEKRFEKVLGSVHWDDLFNETKLMPGKQKKYNYMRDRTFLRPRDMIKFCNEVLNSYRARQNSAEVFSNADIQGAQADYSEYLLLELADEIQKHVPQYEIYLDVIQDIGSAQFTKDEFVETWNKKKVKAKDVSSPIAALAQLYEFSVIGYLAVGGSAGGSNFIYKYKTDRMKFNELASAYRVHWGLKEALNLRRS